ncbi:MAG: Fe-S-containing protein, partial [Elusimicrobiota bacterium]|nr:Fe-S-containing protein [Elusimicrobiota bacterium]
IAFLAAAIYWKNSFKTLQTFENPALARKAKAKIRNLRRLVFITAASFIFSILILSVVKKYNEREVELSPAEAMIIESDNIIIPIANIDDGHLHRFAYAASDGTEVRFIIVKKNASAYGVGLDACDICGQTGYYERSDGIICKRCDVVMNIMTIGFKGGCNPVPLSYSRADGKMIIKTIDLEKEKIRFQ